MSAPLPPYRGPERVVPLDERRTIIGAVLSPLSPQWEPEGSWGYVTCPGQDCHNNSNGRRDCRVYAVEAPGNKVKPPGLYCLHTSCAGVLATVNHKIRSEIGKAKVRGVGRPSQTNGKPSAGAPRTQRTDVFTAPEKGGAMPRTQRTDVSIPLHEFARAHVRAGVSDKPPLEPSAPSVVALPAPQPVAPRASKEAVGQKMPPLRVMPREGSTDTPADCECTLLIDGVVQKGRWVGGEWVTNKKR